MTKRQVFYSFHYESDSWRAAQVRNMGVVEGNRPATDNNWEEIKKGGDLAIKQWIDSQMKYRSCTIVLVGSHTADRKWINYEIEKSWNDGMSVVGICIHGLKDSNGRTSYKGKNPFDSFSYCYAKIENGRRIAVLPPFGISPKLSEVVKCYDPEGNSSDEKYGWISNSLSHIVEEAISIRESNMNVSCSYESNYL